MIQQELHIMH